MKCLHTADLHFSNNDEKRAEVVRVTSAMLDYAENQQLDAIVIAGDLADEYDGRIRVDSPCFADMLAFVQRAASIAPVLIVRGTPSHDRNTPAVFRSIRSANPIFVAMEPCQVWLRGSEWILKTHPDNYYDSPLFSCLPSPDRVAGASISESAANTRKSVESLLESWGEEIPCYWNLPHIIVGHGMLDGADMGGHIASDDQEFSLDAFRLAKPTGVMLGHVHRSAEYFCCGRYGNVDFPVVYSGSPGRLSFGETEDKSFAVWEFERSESRVKHVPTPARRFVFEDIEWDELSVRCMLDNLGDAYIDAEVRVRISVPEESMHQIGTYWRNRVESAFLSAGANKAKLELIVRPSVRSRSEGISREDSLVLKVVRWGVAKDESVEDVAGLVTLVEASSAEELLAGVAI